MQGYSVSRPDLYIVFTGSSVLDIRKSEVDLSRRVLMYRMQGLSFREYLELFHGVQVPDYLVYLEKAGMIGQLRDDTGGLRGLGKVEKIYIDNPNLMSVLAGGKPEIGNLRETFFYNQMRVENEIISSKESDFVIEQYTFEIGGHKKGKKQIANVPHGIIVKDDIKFRHGITVPLRQFGLNY